MIDTTGLDSFRLLMERVLNNELPTGQVSAHEKTVEGILLRMRRYPAETDANRPPPPYYRRGEGKVLASGRVLPTSEQLDTRWTSSTTRGQGVVTSRIENTASYASYVHGMPHGTGFPRPTPQASFHTARQWPPLLAVAWNAVGGQPAMDVEYEGTSIRGSEFEEEVERVAQLVNSFSV